MRLLNVLSMLAVLCAACVLLLITANGFQGYPPPGRPAVLMYGLELFGRWLAIFVPSAVAGIVGFFLNQRHKAIRWPGLAIGAGAALIFTYLNWGLRVGS
jgi:hypothetical protein